MARTRSTVVMMMHDTDEAVLLSDRIVMMTNGPAATIGEILTVNLARPRDREALAEDSACVHCRRWDAGFSVHPPRPCGEDRLSAPTIRSGAPAVPGRRRDKAAAPV